MALGRTHVVAPLGATDVERKLVQRTNVALRSLDRRKPIATPSVFLDNQSRPAAEDSQGRIIFVRQANGTVQGQYSDGTTWQTFLATSVSFATPTIGYATVATAGSLATTIRSDATLKFPTAIMSSANSSTFTLTDDATDQTLTGSLGILNLRSAGRMLSMPLWMAGAEGIAAAGKILSFNARTVDVGTTLTHGVQSQITYDTAVTYTSQTHRSGEFTLAHSSSTVTYSSQTGQVMKLSYTGGNFGASANSWTEIDGLSISMGIPTGSGTTITDIYATRVLGWPILGTGGTITNAASERLMLPTVGATIRRGVWVDPSSTANLGTEAANVEGFYCGAIPRGTAQRTSFYALGATTGTPTMVASFYAAAHGVGTTKWSYYANNESRMLGVQQDDNAKDVYGTGRDAELYYDGTDFVADPDVVGAGSFDIRGPLKCDSITNDTGLAAGVFTPTRSAEANMDANVTMSEGQYARVGNTVTMSGRFTANPTTTATPTSFEMTLPVASNIGAVEDLSGVAFCGSIAAQGAEIIGSVANNTAVVQWVSADVTNQTWSYTLTYQVI